MLLFHLKSSFTFVLKICKILSFFVVMQNNDVIRKLRLISKFTTSQPGKQTIAIYILPNISRSKGNQTIKFGQLIEYNMRNYFIEKSYRKVGGETIPTTFSKKSKLSMSLWINSLNKVFYSLFVLCTKFRATRIYYRPLAFTSYKSFTKHKNMSGTSLGLFCV